ncbi:MAG: 2-oxo acid dehydrogenase subunit E2, partial [Conexivisphaera sp.]
GGAVRDRTVAQPVPHGPVLEFCPTAVSSEMLLFMMIKNASMPLIRETVPISLIRRKIAENLLNTVSKYPQVTLVSKINAENITKIINAYDSMDVHLTPTAVLVKAIALVLAKPDNIILNSELKEDNIVVYDDININVAMDTPYGLMVPVIRNADRKSLREISAAITDLAEKARDGKLSVSDVTGGTFTITNLGHLGVIFFNPIINYPQTAVLGVGRIFDELVLVNDNVKSEKKMYLCLTFNHAAIDGAPAARILNNMKTYLESGEVLRDLLQ